jgi:hypothetical protein
MNLGPYEIALIAGGFTIVGALLGAWIGYRNALNLHRVAEFNKAAAVFRASFVDIIQSIRDTGLMPGDDGWYAFIVKNYTKEFFTDLERAKILFEPHLSIRALSGLNSAWDTFTNWNAHFTKDYKGNKIDFLGHIYSVLEYAQPK